MKFLIDTHLLLWAVWNPARLSADTIDLMMDTSELAFSAASIWETSIKFAQAKHGFPISGALLRSELLDRKLTELAVTGKHAAAVGHLNPIHGDPFDRLLVAQAQVESLILLTADKKLAKYPGVRRV